MFNSWQGHFLLLLLEIEKVTLKFMDQSVHANSEDLFEKVLICILM